MNAVEIEEAVSALASIPFDAAEFPFAFLEAFGNKATTIKRLRSGASNQSDVGGVLQTNNIHIKACEAGQVDATLKALRDSPSTAKAKAKFILATDGVQLQAEDLLGGDVVACRYDAFPDHFGFFLPLAGISTVRQIRESAFDIKATGRLNRLYVQLLKDNPDWGAAERRHDMNHFMARLIFCFFAEDTDIFAREGLFTSTIEMMSAGDSGNTHEIISTLFRAMNTKPEERASAALPRWADVFPYVNGGLFSESTDVPRFSRIARSYLLTIGGLDWTRINPDIFGSMIQAVADEEERGALGMHYTSVPNILKVLNPLFLDELREKLEEAGENARKLLNLRNRMARIRVFDPACGSGNFLVIAYKEMRKIEAEINRRRGEPQRRSDIPLTNFRGIEIRDFPAEIARLALIIAEYQCDVLHRGQKEALAEFLPLDAMNWITCGNALRIDWLSICPPTGKSVQHSSDDLFHKPLDQAQIDFDNEGGETFVCGNPPYIGGKKQNPNQKSDLAALFGAGQHRNLDYVCGFVLKAARFLSGADRAALVCTNSVTQGTHVPVLWPLVFEQKCEIDFACRSFKWRNQAANNAGVSVVVIGLRSEGNRPKRIYEDGEVRRVTNISPYLLGGSNSIVEPRSTPLSSVSPMITGNAAYDGGSLMLSSEELRRLPSEHSVLPRIIRQVFGTTEFVDGKLRYCLWIDDADVKAANEVEGIRERIEAVLEYRLNGGEVARSLTSKPHQFRYRNRAKSCQILVPQVSSEKRQYLPVGLLPADPVVTHLAHVLLDGRLSDFAVLSSRLHLIWIEGVCGKLETRLRYSSSLGWNTFPVPKLTEKNHRDLERSAEMIILAREATFPSTISEIYDPSAMPKELRDAHDHNDDVLERIYIGRRFRNDSERLEKLFELYAQMVAGRNGISRGKEAG